MSFVHLHNHSEYSLLDGLIRLDELPARVRELGMEAVALTDHGVLYGAVGFYKACREEGVKPVIGAEVYVAPRRRTDREPGVDSSPYHLVLLAENNEGYRNLLRLLTLASLEGFYYKPRVDKEALRQHSRGLIALSACLAGEVSRRLLEGETERAELAVREYREIFGAENFFLEIMNHGLPEEERLRSSLRELSARTGVPLVATNDAHYLRREEAEAHDLLLGIQTGKTLSDTSRLRFPNDEFYLKSPAEMAALFPDLPEALENTVRIADRCKVELEFGRLRLPAPPLPPGTTASEELRRLAEAGLKERYPEPSVEARERLAYELEVIERMDFAGYFLIVRDFVHYAKEHGIAVGPGRGSAAGSLTAYLLGITDIDPLRYGLLFERFLNPERVTMPDMDIDFAFERRGEVIEYVTARYGADRVSQIITFGTLGARAAIRDVGRVLEYPLAEVDRLAKMVPAEPGITLERAMEGELGELYRADPRVRRLLDLARAVEGLPRHASVHAAGVVIAPEPLADLVPLQRMNDDTVVTQFAMGELEELGLLKMDFLGLRTLTVLSESVRLIREEHGVEISLRDIPLDDPATYRLLGEGDTLGVFQLESRGMREMLRELRPSRLEDIIAAVSLYRPGPMENIPAFIAQKHGGRVSYPHPALEPILRETYGILVYQEQIMQVASVMAGFSLGEADLLRRAMAKKKKGVLEKERQHFLDGCARQGHPRELAEGLYDLILRFANYGFNKSHGAAYGLLAYQTAYLRANYRTEFLAALLTSLIGDQEKIARYITQSRQEGAEILPPDINRSGRGFTVENGRIRFGLLAIRNVGEAAVNEILRAREAGPFRDLADLRHRVDSGSVHRRVLEALVGGGALDSLGDRGRFWQELHSRRAGRQASLLDAEEEPEAFLDPSERLRLEREALGVYLSGHPLDPYRELLRIWGVTPWEEVEEAADGSEVLLAGLLGSLRNLKTRRGERMASFRLEDDGGAVEAVVYPRLYQEVRERLRADAMVLVRGRLVRSEEGPSRLEVHTVDLVSDWEPLWLEVEAPGLIALGEILARHPGPTPVVVRTQGSWRTHRRRVAVDPGLLSELEDALHPRILVRSARPPLTAGPSSANL